MEDVLLDGLSVRMVKRTQVVTVSSEDCVYPKGVKMVVRVFR